MKFHPLCKICDFEKKLNVGIPQERTFRPEINNFNIYEYICPYGHKNILVRNEEIYELLFEYALYSIVDGYQREGVTTIASSLERFYEYSTKIICTKNAISNEEFDKAWKNTKQSERQLGAFNFAFLIEFKKAPTLLSSKFSSFRNEVVHNGHFPTYKETVEFAEAVFHTICSNLAMLKYHCIEQIAEAQITRQELIHSKATEISKDIIGIDDAILFNTNTLNDSVPQITVTDYLSLIKRGL